MLLCLTSCGVDSTRRYQSGKISADGGEGYVGILKREEKEEEESIGPKQTQGILSERETCFLEIETFFYLEF